MEQQLQQVARHPYARKPAHNNGLIVDLSFDLEAAKRANDFLMWSRLFVRICDKFGGIPSRQLYEFIEECPLCFSDNTRDLRKELFIRYRDDQVLLDLTSGNIVHRARKFTTLLQMGNFVGRVTYLEARALTYVAFRDAQVARLPEEVKDRIKKCDEWNEKHGGRYTEAELVGAGYALVKTDDNQKVFVHPLSRESLTVHTAKNALSDEDRAKMRATRESARTARQMARSANPNKGVSTAPKAEKGGKKKK